MFFHSMNFSIGEDNEALRETVFKFAQKEIAPLADKIDKENSFPNQLWKKLGELGLLGICLLYTSPSPRDGLLSRMPSSA